MQNFIFQQKKLKKNTKHFCKGKIQPIQKKMKNNKMAKKNKKSQKKVKKRKKI